MEVFMQYDGNEPVIADLQFDRIIICYLPAIVAFSKDKNSQKIQFYLPATTVGIYNYNVSIAPLPNEKNTLNNTQNFQ